jgi:RNA polymerase sigma factor (sigma-70 family)
MRECDMNGSEWLAERFEASRGRLRAVAYRLLGSLAEADDAIQEAWLRSAAADAATVGNLEGWLTTVVARVCLNMLRSRKLRREEALDVQSASSGTADSEAVDPEHETLVAESVGVAVLVVLEKLAPAERVAFVLHDVFAVPFEDIGSIVGRSPAAARQLASRARRRVQGADTVPSAGLSQQRETVEAFLKALRAGDVDGMLAVLDPDVVRRADRTAVRSDAERELHGATRVVEEALRHTDVARFAQTILVNGSVGIVVAPHGRLRIAIDCTFNSGMITGMDVIADPERLRQTNLAVLPD